MGIDFDKMKAKRDALENRGSAKSVFWRPEDGEQTIRILPTSDGDPFKQYWFQRRILEKMIRWMLSSDSYTRMDLTIPSRWQRSSLHAKGSSLPC